MEGDGGKIPPLEGDDVDLSGGVGSVKDELTQGDRTKEDVETLTKEEGPLPTKRVSRKTEKSREYYCDLEKKECKRLIYRLNTQEKLMNILMGSDENKEQVLHDSNLYDKTFSDLVAAYTRWIELIDDEKDVENAKVSLAELDTSVFAFKETLYSWIAACRAPSENYHSSRSQRAPSVHSQQSYHSSRSGCSSKESVRSKDFSRHSIGNSSIASRNSVHSNKSLDHRAEAAGLRAEAAVLKRKRQAELEAELLDFDQKIQRAEAMEKIYAKEERDREKADEERDWEERQHVLESPRKKQKKVLREEKVEDVRKEKRSKEKRRKTREQRTKVNSSQDFDQTLLQVLQLQSAPKVDIDVFSGEVLEYQYFVENFREVVERVIPDERGRLTRLIQATEGEAKELIRHCIHGDRKTCYTHAMDLLKQQYGDPHRIATAYLKELREWPMVEQNKSSAFRSFNRFLIKCKIYKNKDQFLRELDSAETLRTLVLKLPVNLQDKWNRKVDSIKIKLNRMAEFTDFCDFVDTESRIVNDPLFSREALATCKEGFVPPPNLKSLRTLLPGSTPEAQKCHMCDGAHDLDDCQKYKDLSRTARMKLLYDKRLCYSCYSENHKANACTQRRTCAVCNKQHPTGLHRHVDPPPPNPEEESTLSRATGVAGDVVSMCVIPVRMSHIDRPDKEVLVYALLDDGSKGTFVVGSALEQLDVPNLEPKDLTIRSMNGRTTDPSNKVDGLVVRCSAEHATNYPSSSVVRLPDTYTREMIPVDEDEIPTPERIKPWQHLHSIVRKIPAYDPSIPIGLLIGANCPKALEPHEVIPSMETGPYAIRSQLGWCVVGPLEVTESSTTDFSCRRTSIDASTNSLSKHHFVIEKQDSEDTSIKELLTKMYDSEFIEKHCEKKSLSQEDRMFLSIMENNCQLIEGHYQLPLPFRNKNIQMPYNKSMAVLRALPLKRRFMKDPKFHAQYCEFMNGLVQKGHAQKCDKISTSDGWNGWFIPHHGVYHPQKPNKIRVVFDGGARYKGMSLNGELLQGPDLTNLQIGVFLRFRKEEVPFMADIKCMFYQVKIPPEQRNFVRFLWWPDGNLDNELCEYEMCVHLFGAVSSPGVANFALQKCAVDYKEQYGEDASRAIMKSFYVDDLLKSVRNEKMAVHLASSIIKMCESGGFDLTKFISPSSKLLKSLPREKRSAFIEDINIPRGDTIHRALGTTYCVERDVLKLRIVLNDKPLTRRGMLSSIQLSYDQDGSASPFIFEGRKILQEVTATKEGWDVRVPDSYGMRWEKWRGELLLLEHVEIPRCVKPKDFGNVKDASLHTFADASEQGYGTCSYLRQVSETGRIHVAFIFAKSRVAPLKLITIPRLELTAATLASKIHTMVKDELMIDQLKEKFWVDSKIVLGYLFNKTRRYKTFVANRVQKVEAITDVNLFDYVDTKSNPADYCSRGISPKDTVKMLRFFNGAQFLWEKEEDWMREEVITEYDPNDEEVKKEVKIKVNQTIVTFPNIVEILELRVSKWSRMRRAGGWILRFIANCKIEVKNRKSNEKQTRIEGSLEVQEIVAGEITILRLVQVKYFSAEMKALKVGTKAVSKQSHVRRLNPFIDDQNIMRVGGRLRKGDLEEMMKHPIIVPKESIIARRIVEWCHMMVQHSGRTMSINELRSRGYWVISASAIVRSVVFKCVLCRGFRGKFGQQKMADLPKERIEPEAPFTCCGVDCFGPFYVKEGRKEMKRYGVLFTCFTLRAIHIEVAHSLTTDSFIMALRRFIARRGSVRSIRSDNGTNFVGADNELQRAFMEMDQQKITDFLAENGCDWIQWQRNPPTASHMGGVWERQIRSVREILQSLLKNNGHILNDESLHTLLLEAEAIVNSRPLTVENVNDPDSAPLSPSQLLTMKAKIVLPPPGVFQKEDLYSRKRWRRVQHLSNEFWQRWRKEFLTALQGRQKWNTVKRNFKVGDIVLLRDDAVIRNHWPRGVVVEACPDSEGLVRTVKIRVANDKSPTVRPISKIVLLVESVDK